MKMGSKHEVGEIDPRGEIYTCPGCGYTDGFHVSFKVEDKTSKADIYLICPNCHRRFRINWQADLSDIDF